MKKRLLGIILSVVIGITSMPVSAMAAQTPLDDAAIEVMEENASDEVATDYEAAEIADETIDEEIDKADQIEESDDANDEEINASVEEEVIDDSSSEELLGAQLLASVGYHGMELSDDEYEDKAELLLTAQSLDTAKADEDYDSDTIMILADTKEEAEKIADCYGAKLTFFDYGVGEATLDFSDENALLSANPSYEGLVPNDVVDIIELAAQDNDFPVVYPNLIYKACGNVESLDEEVIVNAATYGDYEAAQWHHTAMNNKAAWDAGITGKGVTVAIIDTGLDVDHPEFEGKIVKEYNAIKGSDAVGASDDDNGHGSNVGGLVAANKNAVGGTGVAYDASLMSIKVLNSSGKGTSAAVNAGISYAIANNADVINMSLGSSGYSSAEAKLVQEAINKGIIVVAAAGNAADEGAGLVPSYPAAYDNVIAVASLTFADPSYKDDKIYTKYKASYPDSTKDRTFFDNVVGDLKKLTVEQRKDMCLSYFSQFYKQVCIAAPGNAMLSCNESLGYIIESGTSQATPAVAGAIADILQANPEIVKDNSINASKTVKNIIAETAVGSEYSSIYGTAHCGAIDTAAAVNVALKMNGEIVAPEFIGYTKDEKGNIVSGSLKTMTIENKNEAGNIYYTTDGSDPVKNPKKTAMVYSSPISLDFAGKKTFKAVCLCGGKYSKVTTLTANFDAPIEKLYAYNSKLSILAGKSAEVMIGYEPEYAKAPKLEYSVSGSDKFSVDKKGIVKVNKSASVGDIATLTVTDSASGITLDGVNAISLSVKDAAMAGITLPASIDPKKGLAITTYVNKDGDLVRDIYDLKTELIAASNDYDNLIIKSSKKNIVSITKDGKIVAKNPGKTKITIAANDGSKVKKTFNLNVISKVTTVGIETNTGFYSVSGNEATIPLGNKKCQIKLKTLLNEDGLKPTNKKVKYTSLNPEIATVTKGGVIKPAKNVLYGTTATILVESADGYGAASTINVKIYEAVNSIGYPYGRRLKSSLKGTANPGAIINYYDYVRFTVDKNGTANNAYLKNASSCDSNGYFIEKLSNENILGKIDVENLIAGKPGTASLTITTRDGSNKKFKITVKVNKPKS